MADDADGSDDDLRRPYKHEDSSPNGANGGAGGGRRLTEEEAREVQRLIHQGMPPEQARREVLGGS